VSVDIRRPELVFWFGLMGSLLLAFLGLLTSVWAEKFDHAAAVTNFVVTPLSLLSGTFYSVHQLAPKFQAISHANPFFYVISGFRAGFLGHSDSPLLVGGVSLFLLNIALWALCYSLLKSGWKIKN
jgi:ABC-2 type transport system permease protein